jgi:hypothetical protein
LTYGYFKGMRSSHGSMIFDRDISLELWFLFFFKYECVIGMYQSSLNLVMVGLFLTELSLLNIKKKKNFSFRHYLPNSWIHSTQIWLMDML